MTTLMRKIKSIYHKEKKELLKTNQIICPTLPY